MTDEVVVEHAHEDGRGAMELARIERVDGLLVRHYLCTCGHRIVVLAQIEGEQQGTSWPMHWPIDPDTSH